MSAAELPSGRISSPSNDPTRGSPSPTEYVTSFIDLPSTDTSVSKTNLSSNPNPRSRLSDADDNASYRVFRNADSYEPGTKLTTRAIVNDHLRSETTETA